MLLRMMGGVPCCAETQLKKAHMDIKAHNGLFYTLVGILVFIDTSFTTAGDNIVFESIDNSNCNSPALAILVGRPALVGWQ